MNNIILIDDDTAFANSFNNEAASKGIHVAHKRSLDGLKQLLPAYAHKYAAVVLDIKCLMEEEQVKENMSFIASALKYLDTNISGFPRFILTGDDSVFENLKALYVEEKLFLKKHDDQSKLFKELEYYVQNAEPLRIKRENQDVFSAFNSGSLPTNKEVLLINILKRYQETDEANFRGIIGDIREMHETVYKSINQRNKAAVPDLHITANGSPAFKKDFHDHLLGNPDRTYQPTTIVYQDSTINGITKFIHHACSEYLHGTSKINYSISSYTIKSLINGLMEVILWSKKY
jgi:hypothetical protein